MKRIILHVISTIDWFIAGPDGGMGFLSGYPACEQMTADRKEFSARVDTVILGGRTYRKMQSMDVIWPYKEQTTYVISRHDWGGWEDVRFITSGIIETIDALRREPGKDIWLAGGGKLTAMLLAANLVDEMQIATVPVTLGKGISLFPEQPTGAIWEVTDSKTYANGIGTATYRRK